MSQSWTEIIAEMASAPLPELGVMRDVLLEQKATQLDFDLVSAISGVRRCGKSTLLRQIASKAGVTQRSIFVNFEDPRLGDGLDHRLLDAIVAFHQGRHADNRHYFFDEIQNVKGWEKWLHIQLEKRTGSFVITGSNANLLGGELSTALTGRHRTIELFPFSFNEFKKLKPTLGFADYQRQGGFPRALNDIDPASLLREYFVDIIERDVRRHVAARQVTSLVQLAKALAESVGSEVSFRRLASAFDMSVETVKRYVEAFEFAYLFLPCPYWAYSERKRSHRPKKYYCIDAGLRASVTTVGGKDEGKILEQTVFHLLRRRYRNVYYWRDKHEIDFVVETQDGLQPIQVSYHGKTPRQHLAAEEFYRAFPTSLPVKLITYAGAEELALL